MTLLRRFKQGCSLRLVNLLGLSVIFASLLLSFSYLKKEFSYDRHNAHAGRIARFAVQFNDGPVDGRIYGNYFDPLLQQVPEIEKMVKLIKINTGVLKYQNEKQIINNYYLADSTLFDIFTIPLLYGTPGEALQTTRQAIISETLAATVFGSAAEAIGKEIRMESFKTQEQTCFISGVFKNFPEASHFHSDLIVRCPADYEHFAYIYLLLKENTKLPQLAQKIEELIKQEDTEDQLKVVVQLTPLTDIHLKSRVLREMEVNGNIYYLYLIIGANLLLLTVVLFNLWLNARLIFSYSRRYYQLLRLNGASSFTVVRDETAQALLLGFLSILAGGFLSYVALGNFPSGISHWEIAVVGGFFLLLIVLVALLPVASGMSSSLFLNTSDDIKPTRFSYSNVKYMLTAQYIIVIFVVILAFGISKQMEMVKDTQAGGNDSHILVIRDQPWEVQRKYNLLRAELLKNPAIEFVTAAFQLPGDAIRDMASLKIDGRDEPVSIPIMVVGEGFLPFFDIPLLAGINFSPTKLNFQDEEQRMLGARTEQQSEDVITEEYLINRKALATLGFETPEEAIGKKLTMPSTNGIAYINQGIIRGVTDDFNYTGTFETTPPLLILQRNLFLHCIMVHLDPQRQEEALAAFNNVWNEVNPDFPANYSFMQDVYGRLYHNELFVEKLVYLFALLCLLIADLGLIIFMAFIVKRRTREIAIRKVNGAGIGEIIRMLNLNFVRWMALAFVIATPLAWFVLHRWLENFAYRTSIRWWIFALAGLAVLALSFLSVSLQSWRAAAANPAKSIKTE